VLLQAAASSTAGTMRAKVGSDPTLPRIAAVLLAGGSSRAMLASARLSCLCLRVLTACFYVCICM